MKSEQQTLLLQGNQACSMAAIDAGIRFYAGYPITPSTEIAEFMAAELPKVGGKFVQMEDELGGMGAILGASLTGTKVLTATSGPGFSLKQENIGFASMAEIPCVIINVQRLGPSTGGPTAPSQSDVMQAKWGTHGDHPIIALSPASVLECYELMIRAVNFAEKFRLPVILLLDEVIGHIRESVILPAPAAIELTDRKKPPNKTKVYKPYEPDADSIPPMADFGSGYRWHATGLSHDENGVPTGKSEIIDRQMERLLNKLHNYLDEITLYNTIRTDDAEYLIISFGCSARSAAEAVEILRGQGLKAGLLQIQTIWPFPDKIVKDYSKNTKMVVVPELNAGQVILEVQRVLGQSVPVCGINKYNGDLITPDEIVRRVKEAAGNA